MSNTEDWLALIRTKGMGPATMIRLLERFPNVKAIRGASTSALRSAGVRADIVQAIGDVDSALIASDLAWMERSGAQLIGRDDPRYPTQLAEIARPPAALFVLGDPEYLHVPQIAIVGSRRATRGGLDNAREFSRQLASRGLVITSGLALGVDGVSHQAALDVGGHTVAVVGAGLDTVYPREHAELAAKIADSGCVISEYPPGTPPRAAHFPARNRIISGLATGVLVVEAGIRSGSLITARLAAEQNRDVFAIPGSIHNPLARGCHYLIKSGAAKLTETSEDLISEIGIAVQAQLEIGRARLNSEPTSSPVGGEADDPEYKRLLDSMGHDPVSVDRLVDQTGLTVDAVSSMLLILELDGQVESGVGGVYCRRMRSGS